MSRKAQIEALLKGSPDDAFLRFALAKEYEKAGDDATARAQYESLVSDQPDYVGTYYHLGKTLERLGDDRAAFGVYGRGMQVAKRLGEAHAYTELGGARMELGEEE